MSPSPSPIPITVVAASPEWWQIVGALSPLAVLLAAIVAAVVGVMTVRQKARADNRAEWWRRAQWALDASLSENRSEAEIGQKAIELLAKSRLATPEDGELLKIGTSDPLQAADLARQELWTSAGDAEGRVRPRVDDDATPGDNGRDNRDNAGS